MEVDGCVKNEEENNDFPFKIKKFTPVACWSWDTECDTCAICRAKLMESCLRCQTGKTPSSGIEEQTCIVVWGTCNHSYHNCCMTLWIQQNKRCPLCQKEWSIAKTGC
uniref:RING-type domain-containing protein n=1 Tax=Parastrongyloides trichosuri TaxID=131310 RepID=A0A0N4ZPF1_PARTI